MKTQFDIVYRVVLKILVTMAAVGYIIFLIGESTSITDESTFSVAMMYVLFAVFALAYFFLWKNAFISGILLIAWYGLQWILVLWVWDDADMTIVLGMPIFVLGILSLIYGIRQKRLSSSQN